MDCWLVALALALTLLLTALLLPLSLSISLQARGAGDGNFAAAGGAQLGPLTMTLVVARDVPLHIGVSVFGRPLKGSSAAPRAERTRSTEPTEPTEPRWLKALRSKIGLSDVVDFLLGRRRWVGLDALDVALDYSSKNVALTGQILAVMCVASTLLPSKVSLQHNPSWELVDRASLSIDGRFRLWPGLFVCGSLWFLVRTVMLRRRPEEVADRR